MSCCDIKTRDMYEGMQNLCARCAKRLKKKIKDKIYNDAHKAERRKYCASYYVQNKDQVHEQRKQYKEENEEKVKQLNRARYYRYTDKRIINAMRQRISKCLGSRKLYEEIVGCTDEFLLQWFLFNLTLDTQNGMEGMILDNFGSVWHIDHVVPVSTFDLEDQDQVKECFHWKNTRPMLAQENRLKFNKILEEHISEHKERVKLFLEQQGLTTADQS